MNMHTKERRKYFYSTNTCTINIYFFVVAAAFACTYPGCTRTFSVVSNAKRHMRTHGVGVPPDDSQSLDPNSTPYVVGFEAPVIVSPPPEVDVREPLKLRWISPTDANREFGSGSSSAGSSRARSLSHSAGTRDADDIDLGIAEEEDVDGGAWRPNGLYLFPSSNNGWDSLPWKESLSGPSSPRSFIDVHLRGGSYKSFQSHRRVESEG